MCIVIKNEETGECEIIREFDYYQYPWKRFHGPDTCKNCKEWIDKYCKSK